MTTKKDIRKQFLEQRLNLDENTATALNAGLLSNIRQLNFSGIRYIHVFLPILEKKEADTWPIIDYIRAEYPAIQWILSRSDMQNGQMTHYLWTANTHLVKNKYGISEPENGEQVSPELADLVFVPMLAFDQNGQRVGYGKGMYDAFLKACRPDVITVGLSLFGPVPAIPDTDPWDIPLQTVVTPDQIYHLQKNK
ncbi:5-formyltetrahydrofolate cyclo-ligase [Chitinophaga sp. Cy-1792]|uniref:5-formyltetrahydrofolate cyclo-ligase n=1 Tax=Chitinophaga sp. Cy-1792 TaxID=2608339 RepID=UPI001423B476|nr:5-formyltetrahydrofolate cyclo-ligase [Chitinophaga sp. Cy-1792]NIG56343.1 5-formyltetrahydrofolate cyclo-ligase [Chitinophaga sp. Cy-1792]